MKKCPNCGADMPDNLPKCRCCGTPLGDSTPQEDYQPHDNNQPPQQPTNSIQLVCRKPSEKKKGIDGSPISWKYGNTESLLYFDLDSANFVCIDNGKNAKWNQWLINESIGAMVSNDNPMPGFVPIQQSDITTILSELIIPNGGISKLTQVLRIL